MNRRESGFTLIEILIVMAIISALTAGVMMLIPVIRAKASINETRALLSQVDAVLANIERELGEYPPTYTGDVRIRKRKLGKEMGAGNDVNLGIETVCVLAWMPELDVGKKPETKHLINTDSDEAPVRVTSHAKADLFELSDAWLNPLMYINHRDYEGTFTYTPGEETIVDYPEWTVKAHKDGSTGSFYRLDDYQLFSAGPDALPGTDDDVASFMSGD